VDPSAEAAMAHGRLHVVGCLVAAGAAFAGCGGQALPKERPVTTVTRFLEVYAGRDFGRACAELDPALVRDEIRINAIAARPIPLQVSARPAALRDAKRITQTCPGALMLWYRQVGSVLPQVRQQLGDSGVKTRTTDSHATVEVVNDSWELQRRHGRWVIVGDTPLVSATELK
jgi:hypothetical protein